MRQDNQQGRFKIMKSNLKISKEKLYTLIHVNKKTQKEIAEKYKVSRSAVQRRQKRYNIISLKNYERKCPKHISKIQREIILGSILGDDCLYRYNTTLYASLLCYHAISQKKYVDLKFEVWKNFSNYDAPKRIKRDRGTRYAFQTVCHPDFEKIRQSIYSKKTKIVTQKHLDQLSAISLAFWFMDDGSRCKNGGLSIHTNCFTLNEVELCCSYLNDKYNIKCHPQKRKENQYVIFLSNKTSLHFCELILPYVCFSMRYKLEGVYNYFKNPQRLHAMPFKLIDKLKSEDIV